jgi:hypothetical protein
LDGALRLEVVSAFESHRPYLDLQPTSTFRFIPHCIATTDDMDIKILSPRSPPDEVAILRRVVWTVDLETACTGDASCSKV